VVQLLAGPVRDTLDPGAQRGLALTALTAPTAVPAGARLVSRTQPPLAQMVIATH
jgi:hypothetical protein